MRRLALLGGMVLSATAAAALAEDIAGVGGWEIGPIIRGRNYSVGMPLEPTPTRRGWSFEFPYPDERAGHVHYVSLRTGPLAGASSIVMRYRVDAARGARFAPREDPGAPATVSLYVQRRGDSWSGKRHPYHRWYAPPQTVRTIAPGEHEIAVSLGDPGWISVFGQPAAENPRAFAAALAETERVGIVFGHAGGRGHGVYASAPARFTLTGFSIR